MSELFARARAEREREAEVLSGRLPSGTEVSPPLPVLAPPPPVAGELVHANEIFDPRPLPPQARYRWLRRGAMRVIDFYALRQVWFNAAVCRVLNGWNERLVKLHEELGALSAALDDRARARVEQAEERRAAWEGRTEGRLDQMEERLSAAESDASEAVAVTELGRTRLDRLEAEVAELRRALDHRRTEPSGNS